jgi:hypothetical protein
MDKTFNWRSALNEWLQNNPKTIPAELESLRQAFVSRFPMDRLEQLTLEEYALGHEGYKDSFCYWLEWETTKLGSVRGGSSAKWGVWWNSSANKWIYNEGVFDSPTDALKQLTSGMTALLNAAANGEFDKLDEIGNTRLGRNRNSLRAKPLFLYFPDKFLPISSPTHLENILLYFGQEPVDGLHARNRQLLQYLQGLPEFSGFHPMQISRFIYTYRLHQGPITFQNQKKLTEAIEGFVRFANSPLYMSEEYQYKQELLDALENALTQILEGEAEQTVPNLAEVAKAHRTSGTNLSSWQEWDKFTNYLERIPAEEIKAQLVGLLEGDGDIVERIDMFRQEVERAFQTYEGESNTLLLGLISQLLMAYARDNYIFYRASIIDKACDDWEAPKITKGPRKDGQKYTEYLDLVLPLRDLLTKSLNRQADLIDVHNLLWFNFTDTYDQFKQKPDDSTETVEERPFMQQLLRIAKRSRNIILYGPPGTGKTYWVREFSRHFGDRTDFVTFHQSFAYEDFIEGWRPKPGDEGAIRYDIQDGIFKQICQRATANPDREYLLVIDEINRANIAKVFGELITLIEDDKRVGMPNELQSTLTYSAEPFGVPKNLYIVGTMNTADRSIALLDIALRRRFTFVSVTPNPELLSPVDGLPLSQLLQRLNERIKLLLDQDHQIGHSYFMDVKNVADLRFAWEHRVIPLLQEYFYNDGERLQALIGRAFIKTNEISKESREALIETADPDVQQYEMADLSDEAFLEALRHLSGTNGN